MPLHEPIISEISAKTYLINEFGLDAMFLLVGKERALLIDTGSGYFDLKKTVESLTDKPYDVALTHGHVDHAGGCGAFSEIWLHPADIEMARSITADSRRSYGKALKGVLGDADVWDYGDDDVFRWKHMPIMRELDEDMVFDLGGRRVSIVRTPGHTKGSCSFIDDSSRILFSGDAANSNLLMNLGGATVETALKGLEKLKGRQKEFDRNYNGHIGYSGYVNCVSQPDSMLDDCIAAMRGIMNGTLTVDEYENFLFPGKKNYAVSYGATRITFAKDAIFDK